MDGLREQFLSRAAFPEDQHGLPAAREPLPHCLECLHHAGIADEIVKRTQAPARRFLCDEVPDLAFELLEVAQQLLNALIVVRGNDHFRKAADQIPFVVQNGATAA